MMGLRVSLAVGLATLLCTSCAPFGGTAKAPRLTAQPVPQTPPGIRLILSNPPREEGLSLRQPDPGSENVPVERAGRAAWVVKEAQPKDGGYLYFVVSQPAFRDGKTPAVEIVLRYFDEGKGLVRLVYDSADEVVAVVPTAPGAWKEAGRFVLADTKAWKQLVCTVDDARFSGRCNGADLRLEISGSARPPIAEVSLTPCAGIGPIGPTRIPFYTGNLSVLSFMERMGTHSGPIPPNDWASPSLIAQLKRTSCIAECDYQGWAVAERERDRWDFSLYSRNADLLHAAGIKYVAFSWVHFPPTWFLASPEFVPYQCAEHGEKLLQLSPWAPQIWDIHRRFYTAQRQAMGDRIDWIRVSTPSDYGEIGYPAAMTSWLVPQQHAHAGYWCGDPYAVADFKAEMERQFGSLDRLNERWGTSFGSWTDLTYPELIDEKAAATARATGKVTDRRRWLDFVDWYYGSWQRFVPKMVALVRDVYPGRPLIVSVGYASERTVFGNDYSAIPKMAKKAGVAVQTPGVLSHFMLKRLSTASHFYGTTYYTEPPGDVPPDEEIARVFYDVSNGIQAYFEYVPNLDRVRRQMQVYKDHMTGARPLVDLAIFHPNIQNRLACGAGSPPEAYILAEKGRDRFDWDVVDEYLLRDGALAQYRVLVYASGNVTERFALERIKAWVRKGGILVTCDLGEVETVEGDAALWQSLLPPACALAEVRPADQFEWPLLASRGTQRLGKGLVIRVPVTPGQHDLLLDAVAHTAHNLTDFGKGFHNAPLVDGLTDSVQATLLPDRILYFNGTDQEIVKPVRLRPEDWKGRKRRPARLDYQLRLAPHSIEAILLE